MPLYFYKARDKKGTLRRGEIEAINEEKAASLLREHGLVLTYLVLKEKVGGLEKLTTIFKRVSSKEKVIFTRQLSTMINSGLPIIQALKTLASQTRNETFKEILQTVVSDIEGGSSLSDALSHYPRVFPKVYVSLIKSGEASGKLDEVLLKLANQMESDYETLSKIKSAMYYPAFIMAALIAVGIIMLIYVIPQIQNIFAEAAVTLPLPTRILLWTSNTLRRFGLLILIALGVLVSLFRSYINTKEGRLLWDSFKLKVPIFGKLLQKIYMARFTRTLGTLIAGGLPILDALDITSEAVGNVIYAEGIQKARKEVENGVALAEPLKEEANFPVMVPQMIAVGEETGKLDEILFKLAAFFDSEVDAAVRGLSSLIEPILIVVMGIGVAILVASIILPIYQLTQAIT